MPTDIDFEQMQREATELYRSGDLAEGINRQLLLVNGLLDLGAQTIKNHPGWSDLLDEAANQAIDLLRWQQRLDPAIALNDRLAKVFPESAPAYLFNAAQLRIEAGQIDAGLTQLIAIAAQEPENYWFQISLGTSYQWLGQYDAAEAVLRRCGEMSHVRKVDRALAYQYLFRMYSRIEERTAEALAAWREASRLDGKLRAEMLPAVCRMLIYWRRYDDAKMHVAMIRNRVQQLFYQGLLHYESGNAPAGHENWRTILLEYSPEDNMEVVDEYAEACIRMLSMTKAVNLLQPLVDAGQLHYYRLVVLGLAWAQKRDLGKACWCLDTALRLGDAERIRLTRPAPQGRMLDIQARLLYADIVVDPDIRAALNRYFMPVDTEKN